LQGILADMNRHESTGETLEKNTQGRGETLEETTRVDMHCHSTASQGVAARAREPRLRLLLAGGGPEQERLHERLGEAASFLGWLEGEDRVSGLLRRAEAGELADALLELTRSPLLREHLSRGALRSARSRTWERTLELLAGGYRRALEHPHGDRRPGPDSRERAA
jgi:glycosyltransferase involved in cell wall biosynthesis